MKIGFMGDTQFKGKDLDLSESAWDQTLADMKRRGVSWVCHTGDVCESGNVWDAKATAQQIVNAFIRPVERYGIPVLIVEGNHDYHDPLGPAGLDLFRHPLIRIVQKDLKAFDLGDHRILCLPWQDRTWVARNHNPLSWDLWKERLESDMRKMVVDPQKTLLLGHVSIRGAVTESGYAMDQGDLSWDRHRLASICKLAVFGHVHRPQVLWNEIESVGVYAGCIRQNSYGEAGCYTGWLEVDTTLPAQNCYQWRPVVAPWHWNWTKGEDLEPLTQILPPQGDALILPLSLCRVKVKEVPPAERADVATAFRQLGVDLVEFKATRTLAPQLRDRENVDDYVAAFTFEQQFRVWLREQGIAEIPTLIQPLVQQFNTLAADSSVIGALDSIHSITLENIGGHVHTVAEFAQGWNAVLGSNGAGKSSLLESLFACAYNTWVSADRDSPGATVPAGLQGQITVDFSSGGTVYRVQRQWKGPASTLWLYQQTNSGKWNVIAGGPDKSKVAVTMLRKILGSEEALLGSAFLQQGPADLISGPAATAGQRMLWMREWLGFQALDEMLKRAQVLAKGYAGAARKLESVEKAVFDCQEEMSKIQGLIGPCQTHLGDVRAKIEATIAQLHERVAWLAKAEVALVWEERRDKMQHDIFALEATEDNFRTQLTSYQQELEMLEIELESVAGVRQTYHEQCKERETLQTLSSPLCNAGCRPNYLSCPFIDQAVQANQKLVVLEAAEVSWEAEEEALYEENSRLAEDLRKRVALRERELLNTQSRLRSLREALATLEPDMVTTLDDVKHAQDVVTYQRQMLPQLQQTEEQLNAQFHSMNGRWKLLSEKLEHLLGERETLRKSAEMEEALDLLVRATGKEGISQRLIHSALPAIQQQLDNLLQLIDVDFTLSLSTLVENAKGVCSEGLSLMFHQGKKKHDVRSCSKGQQSLIRVLWRWAVLLARSEVSYRVLFLDEPTAANDEEYTEIILQLLSALTTRFSQILLVSHDPRVVSGVPTKLYIERQ